MPPEESRRGVIREPRFEQEYEQLGFDAVRADEFTEGAEWILSREPQFGTKVARNVWFLSVGPASENLNLYYTFDERNVYFLSLQRASEEVE